MDEWDEGKARLTDLVRTAAPDVSVVIPVRPTGGMFLIAFARGRAKKFLSVSEDDLIDLVDDHAVETQVMAKVHDAIKDLSAGG
ncbi:MAG: hypothetical protein AB1451_15290 [Nitrospirota bacterium]